jgi:hypothetical protein
VDVGCGGARVTGSIPPIAVLTLIGMLSAFGVIGKFIVG